MSFFYDFPEDWIALPSITHSVGLREDLRVYSTNESILWAGKFSLGRCNESLVRCVNSAGIVTKGQDSSNRRASSLPPQLPRPLIAQESWSPQRPALFVTFLSLKPSRFNVVYAMQTTPVSNPRLCLGHQCLVKGSPRPPCSPLSQHGRTPCNPSLYSPILLVVVLKRVTRWFRARRAKTGLSSAPTTPIDDRLGPTKEQVECVTEALSRTADSRVLVNPLSKVLQAPEITSESPKTYDASETQNLLDAVQAVWTVQHETYGCVLILINRD